jgi:hypothetical protein
LPASLSQLVRKLKVLPVEVRQVARVTAGDHLAVAVDADVDVEAVEVVLVTVP